MLRLASLAAPCAVFLVSATAFANGSTATDYGTSFGTATDQGASVATTDMPATGAGMDDLTALRNLSSFPVRVHLGEGRVNKGWSDPVERAYQPQTASRHFKAANCEFYIKTGEFTLRRYQREGAVGEEALVVSKDPVARFSTLVGGRQPVLVSVNTELYVQVADGQKAACKALFGGRHIRLGLADLGRTILTAKDETGTAVEAQALRDSQQLTVYLTWDDSRDQLALEDNVGLPPAVESAVFTVNPPVAGDYYLAVQPALSVDRSRR